MTVLRGIPGEQLRGCEVGAVPSEEGDPVDPQVPAGQRRSEGRDLETPPVNGAIPWE